MKMHSAGSTVEKSAGLVAKNYSIEGSAKAFMILSDGMYSDKILAVIREISTNAYDSHVDAGYEDRPFEVHLPTSIEPYFYVRDFGTSMTDDQCQTLYTTFFKSTKTNTNDAVGCLGLGSKSPLAYSNSFTVEAYLNGEKRIYSGLKDTSGKYEFVPMQTSTTDEPNGIKVSVPVLHGDIAKFHNTAAEFYKYWRIKPIVNTKINMNMPEPLFADSDNRWAFYDLDDNYVVMGNVAYKVDNYELRENLEDSDSIKFCYGLNGLVMRVNIGDVDFTPSRESLSFNPQTKAKLQEIISSVMKGVKNSVETAISSQPTLYLARKKYVELQEKCGCISSVMDNLKDSILWNNTKLFDTMAGNKFVIRNNNVTRFNKSYRTKIDIDKNVREIYLRGKTSFAIDDLGRGATSRIKQYLSNNRGELYVYTLQPGETVQDCAFFNLLGGATMNDVVLVSSMPKVERISSTSYNASNTEVQYYDQYSDSFKTCKLSVKEQDAVYIPVIKPRGRSNIYHHKAVINGKCVDLNMVHGMLTNCYKYRHFDKRVFFISQSVVENRKLDKRDNWEGPEWFLDKVRDIASGYQTSIRNMVHRPVISYERFHKAILATQTPNKAKELVNEYNERMVDVKNNERITTIIINACVALGLNDLVDMDPGFDNRAEFYLPLNEEMKKYPIIEYLSYLSSEAIQRVADYIDLIENQNQVLTDNVLSV
jgi:hypothetical protein